MTSGGGLLDRFGARVLMLGLATAALLMVMPGMILGNFAAVASCMVLLGVTLGLAASGAVAAAGGLFPVALQSSGLGWAMGDLILERRAGAAPNEACVVLVARF